MPRLDRIEEKEMEGDDCWFLLCVRSLFQNVPVRKKRGDFYCTSFNQFVERFGMLSLVAFSRLARLRMSMKIRYGTVCTVRSARSARAYCVCR